MYESEDNPDPSIIPLTVYSIFIFPRCCDTFDNN